MIIEELNNVAPIEGVIRLSEVDNSFEDLYQKVITKEKRNYSNDELRLLPFASNLNPHKAEWNLRTKSFLRFNEYLKTKNSSLNILDLGCGSGWFSAKLSSGSDHIFYCVDINLAALRTGAKIFTSPQLKFIYADLFKVKFPRSSFDIIVLNSSLQFFPDITVLMRELLYLITQDGEIHIVDTPFYKQEELALVESKTASYYKSLGIPQMKGKHFHCNYSSLSILNHTLLYDPRSIKNKLLGIIFGKDSNHPWIIIKK